MGTPRTSAFLLAWQLTLCLMALGCGDDAAGAETQGGEGGDQAGSSGGASGEGGSGGGGQNMEDAAVVGVTGPDGGAADGGMEDPAAPTGIGMTSGGGRGTSTQFTLQVGIGAPIALEHGEGDSHRLRLGSPVVIQHR